MRGGWFGGASVTLYPPAETVGAGHLVIIGDTGSRGRLAVDPGRDPAPVSLLDPASKDAVPVASDIESFSARVEAGDLPR